MPTMPKRKMSKCMKRVTLTVDPDDYEEIRRLAVDNDVSTSWLVRRSMRLFLERLEGKESVEITLKSRKNN